MAKRKRSYRSEYESYQPDNPLTIYFSKLIHKDINNNIVGLKVGSKQSLKQRTNKGGRYGPSKGLKGSN